jgi:hypothetical protein
MDGVRVGVMVGVSVGAKRAVWVAAAPAVSTMAVRGEFGSRVGRGAEPGSVGSVGTHASIRRVIVIRREVLYLRRIIVPTPI